MANPRHLEVLQGGVDAWNRWRVNHPRVRPDLSGARARDDSVEDILHHLVDAVSNTVVPGRAPTRRAGLTGADLEQVNFRGTNLSGARLNNAMLIEAGLTRASARRQLTALRI